MGDRCTGHCCREFSLPAGRDYLAAQAFWWLALGTTVDDLANGLEHAKIASMIIPSRIAEIGDLLPDGRPAEHRQNVWTCSHFDGENCTDYEHRPRMCSAYPYNAPCGFVDCAWDAGRAGTHPRRASGVVRLEEGKVHLPIATSTIARVEGKP